MSERLIDSVCPHCGRLKTTVRVVNYEDGFTKLGRLCKSCGGEWIHTFDADWLAVAKMRRLEAEVERLRARVEVLETALRHYADDAYNGHNTNGSCARAALEATP